MFYFYSSPRLNCDYDTSCCVSPQCGGVLGGHGRTDGQWKRGHRKDPERKGKHQYSLKCESLLCQR